MKGATCGEVCEGPSNEAILEQEYTSNLIEYWKKSSRFLLHRPMMARLVLELLTFVRNQNQSQ
jgi:hypothetical protein